MMISFKCANRLKLVYKKNVEELMCHKGNQQVCEKQLTFLLVHLGHLVSDSFLKQLQDCYLSSLSQNSTQLTECEKFIYDVNNVTYYLRAKLTSVARCVHGIQNTNCTGEILSFKF